MTENSLKFEDHYDEIMKAIRRRRRKWYSSINIIDFNDIEMIIVHHIYKKWSKYNDKQPLMNWVNRIISNQFKNILRDYIKKESKLYYFPAEPNPNITDSKSAAGNHAVDFGFKNFNKPELDFDRSYTNVITRAKEILTEQEYVVFDMLFIQHISELEVSQILGYKITQSSASYSYNKTIKNIKDIITHKIREEILNGGIDVISS